MTTKKHIVQLSEKGVFPYRKGSDQAFAVPEIANHFGYRTPTEWVKARWEVKQEIGEYYILVAYRERASEMPNVAVLFHKSLFEDAT